MRKIAYIVFFVSSALCAMEQNVPQAKALFAPQVHKNEPSIKSEIIKAITTLEQGSVAVDMFVLTDPTIINVLCNAKKRGLTVSVNLDGTRSDNTNAGQILHAAGIAVDLFNQQKAKKKRGTIQNLHCKCICYDGKTKEERTLCGVIEGSYNFSNLAPHHEELMIQTENDQEFYQQHLKMHNHVKQQCLLPGNQVMRSVTTSPPTTPTREGKKIVVRTPQKRKAIDSIDYHLLDALKERIDCAKPHAILDLNFLTFNHQAMKNSLLQAADRSCVIRIFIDGSEVKSSQAFLNELARFCEQNFI